MTRISPVPPQHLKENTQLADGGGHHSGGDGKRPVAMGGKDETAPGSHLVDGISLDHLTNKSIPQDPLSGMHHHHHSPLLSHVPTNMVIQQPDPV